MPEQPHFHEIPRQRPHTPMLDRIDVPEQLRELAEDQLEQLCYELRAFLLYTVGQTGGHFGAGLGVVELTIALHYIFNTPEDRIVWDVGHQAYPHKILTGRRERMHSMRQQGGLAAFPCREESPFDTFGVGHSSTSISAVLGMALAARMQGSQRRSIAVIGDGALTAGMAFEALSHAGDIAPDMLVILNDNDMSISNNVGGLKNHLARILSGKTYNQVRDGSKQLLSATPGLMELARKTEEHVKGLMVPASMFEELGLNYIGPIDGHDLPTLLRTLENMKDLKGPQFLHIVTKKGKGFAPAEADPIGYHAINKIEVAPPRPQPLTERPAAKRPKYSNVFGAWLCDMAAIDPLLVGITPAMREGSDLVRFSEQFPDRYHDVAIAEQHAVTLAAGMACEGAKPVVAIYSTFLQRAYDQLIHDVAVQNLDVLFAIDRAGLVGEDGPTHAGSFDLSFLRCIPNMMIMAPADENECRQMLYTGYCHEGPAAVRYPRGTGPGVHIEQAMTALPIAARPIREGKGVAILSFGALLPAAKEAAEAIDAAVWDMRFIKPLDTQCIQHAAEHFDLIVTLEENVIAGGAGSGVAETLVEAGLVTPILHLGLPDQFVEHGKPADLLHDCGLDGAGVLAAIKQHLETLGLHSRTLEEQTSPGLGHAS